MVLAKNNMSGSFCSVDLRFILLYSKNNNLRSRNLPRTQKLWAHLNID
jgi:hypothetical protein